jgi:hypothetical protein
MLLLFGFIGERGHFFLLGRWELWQACPERKACDFEKITLTESKSNAIPQNNSTNKVNFIVFKVILTLFASFDDAGEGNILCKIRKNRENKKTRNEYNGHIRSKKLF